MHQKSNLTFYAHSTESCHFYIVTILSSSWKNIVTLKALCHTEKQCYVLSMLSHWHVNNNIILDKQCHPEAIRGVHPSESFKHSPLFQNNMFKNSRTNFPNEIPPMYLCY